MNEFDETEEYENTPEEFGGPSKRAKITKIILRIVGWLMMYMGIKMILKPLSVLGDVLPFIGNIIEMGAGIIAFFVSAIVALLVIAIAWIFYRPVLGIILLVAAGGLVYLFIKRKKKSAPAEEKTAEEAPAEEPAPAEETKE